MRAPTWLVTPPNPLLESCAACANVTPKAKSKRPLRDWWNQSSLRLGTATSSRLEYFVTGLPISSKHHRSFPLMSQKLRIPTHYYVYSDPPDQQGDETLHFVSAHRRVRMRGHSFRDFVQNVVPLLNGTRTVEEIQKEVADLFAAEDLHACLEMLGNHGMLEDVTESAIPAELSDF